MSFVDTGIDWVAERWLHAKAAFKYRTPRKAPAYLAAELQRNYGFEDLVDQYDYEQLQRLSLTIPWIYSNIEKIAKEISSAPFHVYERKSEMRDIEHDLERVIQSPNDFFSGTALFQYLIWALYLDRQGAYWFLAPDSGDGSLREIWPFPINRVRPIKHGTKFISGYVYQWGSGPKDYSTIPAQNVCRFFLPDPRNLHRSMTPLAATQAGINLYEGIAKSQDTVHNQSRGIPLSVVAVPKDLNDADFNIIRQQIRDDWTGGNPIAVTRAGSLDVKTIGISARDLETFASREYNRDEIDSVFMGFPWRNGDADLKVVEQQIKDQVIFPLHSLIAGQIQVHVVEQFYGEQYVGRFDDVRRQDRALLIQERNAYWRGYTFEEVRRDLGKEPFKHELLKDYEKLPFELATNPQFVIALYKLNPAPQQEEEAIPGELKGSSQEIGNIVEGEAPEKLSNRLARGGGRQEPYKYSGVNVDKAIQEAQHLELKRWRTVTLRALERDGLAPSAVEFETDLIDNNTRDAILSELSLVNSTEGVKKVFTKWLSAPKQEA